jgi:hypothetical protein
MDKWVGKFDCSNLDFPTCQLGTWESEDDRVQRKIAFNPSDVGKANCASLL